MSSQRRVKRDRCSSEATSTSTIASANAAEREYRRAVWHYTQLMKQSPGNVEFVRRSLDVVELDAASNRGVDAMRELEKDEVIRAGLGRGKDEDYVDYFVRVKQREFREWHDQVTQWEVDRYLQLF